MRKLLLFAFVLGATAQMLFAQGNRLSGTVKDRESGEPLPGVTLRVDGERGDHQTDGNGAFSIPVSGAATFTLVVSSVGFETQRLSVRTGTRIEVLLAQENVMDEVVVIGYGTTRRKDLTASVSSVGARDLKDIPINSAEQALAGRLAGVQVTGAEGSPDASVNIRVRGGISITQNNEPLYVVDGVIVSNALSMLSPQDIESVDVLKDASSTAIYGARGANGVVIITTKGGKAGVTNVNYNGFLAVQQLQNKLSVLDPYNFVLYQYEHAQRGVTQREDFLNRYGAFEDLELYKQAKPVDWQMEVFGRNALMQTHNASVNGGTEKTQFNLSLTGNIADAIMQGSSYDRKLINFRLAHKVSDRFKVSFDARYNNTVVTGQGTATAGSSGNNFLRQALRYTPFLAPGVDIYHVDLDLIDETNNGQLYLVNPLRLIESQYRKNYGERLNFGGFAEFAFTKYLSVRSTVGYNVNTGLGNQYDDELTSNSRQNGNRLPIASVSSSSGYTINNSNVLTFNNAALGGDFNEKNRIDLMVGQEILESRSKSHSLIQRYFPAGTQAEKAFANLGLASPPAGFFQPAPSSGEGLENTASFFARASWNYGDKYLANASVRWDGSSVFAAGRHWGRFPAAAVAWRVSEEQFMENMKPVLSDMKFRASWGESGNNRIGGFLYLTQFAATGTGYGLSGQLTSAYLPTGLANTFLKWEANVSKNLGLDIAFVQNRFRLSLDFYVNDSKDLLMNMTIPPTSGYTSQIQNVGATSNRGWEAQLGMDVIQKKSFSWTADFNISFNRNTIKTLGGQSHFFQNSGWMANNPADFIVEEGGRVGAMFGLVNDGFYGVDDFNYDAATGAYTLKAGVPDNSTVLGYAPQPGIVKFRDLNGDDIINIDDDRQVIGQALPRFFGGLNQQFAYRGFDLSVFLNFQYGNNVYNYNKLEFSSGYTTSANMLDNALGRWRTINDQGQVVTNPTELAALNANATIWRPVTSGGAFVPQSWAVEDGAFIRLNNVTLGYTLPQKWSEKAKIRNLRVYATGNNLAVFTNYSGYDPEVNTRRGTPMTPSVDFSAYPRSRMYVFGLNITL